MSNLFSLFGNDQSADSFEEQNEEETVNGEDKEFTEKVKLSSETSVNDDSEPASKQQHGDAYQNQHSTVENKGESSEMKENGSERIEHQESSVERNDTEIHRDIVGETSSEKGNGTSEACSIGKEVSDLSVTQNKDQTYKNDNESSEDEKETSETGMRSCSPVPTPHTNIQEKRDETVGAEKQPNSSETVLTLEEQNEDITGNTHVEEHTLHNNEEQSEDSSEENIENLPEEHPLSNLNETQFPELEISQHSENDLSEQISIYENIREENNDLESENLRLKSEMENFLEMSRKTASEQETDFLKQLNQKNETINELENDIERLKREKEVAIQMLPNLQEQIELLNEENSSLKKASGELQEDSEYLKTQYNLKVSQLIEREQEIKTVKDQLKNSEELCNSAVSEMEVKERRVLELEHTAGELKVVQSHFDSIKQQFEFTKKELAQKKQENESLETELKENQVELKRIIKELSECKDSIVYVVKEKEAISTDKADLQAINSALKEKSRIQILKIKALEVEKNQLEQDSKSRINQLQQKIENDKWLIASFESDVDKLEKEIKNDRRIIASLETDLENSNQEITELKGGNRTLQLKINSFEEESHRARGAFVLNRLKIQEINRYFLSVGNRMSFVEIQLRALLQLTDRNPTLEQINDFKRKISALEAQNDEDAMTFRQLLNEVNPIMEDYSVTLRTPAIKSGQSSIQQLQNMGNGSNENADIKTLQEENERLKIMAETYLHDFEDERRDRERLAGEMTDLKGQMADLKRKLEIQNGRKTLHDYGGGSGKA